MISLLMERLELKVAITRLFEGVGIQFLGDGTMRVVASATVIDDSEQSASTVSRVLNNPTVIAAAAQLRDAVMTLAANLGKPLTLPSGG